MRIENNGSVVLFVPTTPAELQWLRVNTQNEDWQWQGDSLVVDHRPAQFLMEAVQELFPIE
jgi:hypothetical protein